MTDRKLLKLAAKAAGLNGFLVDAGLNIGSNAAPKIWNPITDDGDALRLAVKCGISVLQFPACIGIKWPQIGLPYRLFGVDPPYEDISSGQDVFVATRRAIFRAAAEIGRNT